MKSITVTNPWLQIKQLLSNNLPIHVINLYKIYKIYKYNLSTVVERKPSSFMGNLLTTTQKLIKNRKKILSYPDLPGRKYTITQICLFLGYEITNNPEETFDVAIKWKNSTFSPSNQIFSCLSVQNINIVNIRCEDISKSHLNKVFQTVFGYGAAVDPLTYTGKCVVKSNLNYKHDGKIVSCPISTIESGVVYEKLIDNEVEDGKVIDIRVPVFKNLIPFVFLYLKEGSSEKRFYGYPSLISVRLAEVHEVFSQDELSKILCFCQKMGLDYGELDVLRDRTDRRLYIVDANNTPASRLLFEPLEMPPDQCLLSSEDRLNALQKLSQAFQEALLS